MLKTSTRRYMTCVVETMLLNNGRYKDMCESVSLLKQAFHNHNGDCISTRPFKYSEWLTLYISSISYSETHFGVFICFHRNVYITSVVDETDVTCGFSCGRRFGILTAMNKDYCLLESTVVQSGGRYQCFGGICSLRLQGRKTLEQQIPQNCWCLSNVLHGAISSVICS